MPKRLLCSVLFLLSHRILFSQVLSEAPFPPVPYKNVSSAVTADRFGPFIIGASGQETEVPVFDQWYTVSHGFTVLRPGTPQQKRVLFPMAENGKFFGFGGNDNRIRSSYVRTSPDSLFLLWSNVNKEYTDVGPFVYLKSPVTRLSVQESDSFRTIAMLPNGIRPDIDADQTGVLHMVWEQVTPFSPSPTGSFYRYSSSVLYRKRSPLGLLSDSLILGKGFTPSIRSMKGAEFITFIAADSINQPDASFMFVKGENGVYSSPQSLYQLTAEMMGGPYRFIDWFDDSGIMWDVDSTGGFHSVQRINRYPIRRLMIAHRSPEGNVWLDSLPDPLAQFRIRPDGSVSMYRFIEGAPNSIEHYTSKHGTPVQKNGMFTVPPDVTIASIVVGKNGMEHLLLQQTTNEQGVYLVRNAEAGVPTISIIGKGLIVSNASFTDDKNSVLLTGTKAGAPLLLRFSLDSLDHFQDFHFPLAVGNEWYYAVTEFSDPGGPPPPTYETARADSLKSMPNGKQYLRITSKRWMPSYYRQEGLRVYQYSPADSLEYLRMDFSKRQGDTIAKYGPFAFQKGIVELRKTQALFGVNAWSFAFSGMIPKLDSVTHIVAMDTLGIIGRMVEVGPTWSLIGAKLNGRTYGTTLSAGEPTIGIPTEMRLEQNYPNPFNPTTVISYQLSATGQTTLIVYDMLGREIALLVNDVKGPGSYTVPFDASKFSSGVYFVKLQSNGRKLTRKMLLMK